MTNHVADFLPRVEIHGNREFAAFAAARRFSEIVRVAIAERGVARILMASAPSQSAFLAAITRDRSIAWNQVDAFHLDEWVGVGAMETVSLGRFLRNRIPSPPARLDWIRGDAPDPNAECERYTVSLRADPLDIACVGFGDNGHLAFNEPGSTDSADSRAVRVVAVAPESRQQQVDDGLFADVRGVPTHAISVTVPTILSARNILVIAPGMRKSDAVRAALEGPVDEAVPASLVRRHHACSVYLDEESASLLTGR